MPWMNMQSLKNIDKTKLEAVHENDLATSAYKKDFQSEQNRKMVKII